MPIILNVSEGKGLWKQIGTVRAYPPSAIIGAENDESCRTFTWFVVEYVMVPYADYNLLKFPDKEQALSKIRDLTILTDLLPTGFFGAVTAGIEVGSTVYVAGLGPVGLAVHRKKR